MRSASMNRTILQGSGSRQNTVPCAAAEVMWGPGFYVPEMVGNSTGNPYNSSLKQGFPADFPMNQTQPSDSDHPKEV